MSRWGLTVVMTILLAIIIKSDSRTGEEPDRYLILHGLTTLTAVGMGYTGGQVLFG
ncbi:hypothetical protein KKI24_18510 [bacterium]|nr:hypothetical protein [bacterium]